MATGFLYGMQSGAHIQKSDEDGTLELGAVRQLVRCDLMLSEGFGKQLMKQETRKGDQPQTKTVNLASAGRCSSLAPVHRDGRRLLCPVRPLGRQQLVAHEAVIGPLVEADQPPAVPRHARVLRPEVRRPHDGAGGRGTDQRTSKCKATTEEPGARRAGSKHAKTGGQNKLANNNKNKVETSPTKCG